MLILHEVHTVAGRHEDDFEAHVRDRWLPAVAEHDDARLLWFAKVAFATGRAYQVVTVTALRDGAAYERLVRRVHDGDLRGWAATADRFRHDVAGRLLVPVAWSPDAGLDLAAVPLEPQQHEPVLYLEDDAWPHEARLDDYLDAARTHYAPSLEVKTERSLLGLVAVWQAAIGAARRREVVLWQRVEHPERLTGLFARELPPEVKRPGTWMHDALAVRDDWQSHLLRVAPWSPLS